MKIASSRLTSQGQISVPAEIRKRLGIGPGSVLEWDIGDGIVTVRRAGKYTFVDIHRALFPKGPPERRSVEEMDDAIRTHLRGKHGRTKHAGR